MKIRFTNITQWPSSLSYFSFCYSFLGCSPTYIALILYQEAIFRTLAAILHLGNVEFSPGEEHDSSIVKDQKSSFHMQTAANLFM